MTVAIDESTESGVSCVTPELDAVCKAVASLGISGTCKLEWISIDEAFDYLVAAGADTRKPLYPTNWTCIESATLLVGDLEFYAQKAQRPMTDAEKEAWHTNENIDQRAAELRKQLEELESKKISV
jgi:hypothetical protein